jgi:hypothetical protein
VPCAASTKMTIALSNNNQNLEKFLLIWLDNSINTSEENLQAQNQLRT